MPTEKISKRAELLLVFLLFSFLVFLLPYLPGHGFDNQCWQDWAWFNYTNGLRNAYGSGTNYLPLYHYILWGYAKLVGNADHLGVYINNLRAFTLLFDIIGLWLVYRWIDRRWPFYLLVLLNMLNLGYSYNTLIWGQVDGILATLVFASIFLAAKNKLVWSAVTIVLALNMKLQAIVFIPVWGLVYLYYWAEEKKWKQLVVSIFAMAGLQLLILLPFMQTENGLQQIWKVVISSAETFPKVSMNAFNFWHLFTTIDPWQTNDENIYFAGLSYRKAGLLLFFAASFFVLFPLLRKVWLKWLDKPVTLLKEEIWLTGALIGLLFFYLNTQMHERYCHPAFIFLTAYAFYTRRFFAYIVFSIAYFLNLEKVMQTLHFNNYSTLLFSYKFIAALYLLAIVSLVIELVRIRRQPKTTLRNL